MIMGLNLGKLTKLVHFLFYILKVAQFFKFIILFFSRSISTEIDHEILPKFKNLFE